MTNEEVKRYLKQIIHLRKAIDIKSAKIMQLKEQATSITVALTDDVVHQGGKMNDKSFADAINAALDLQIKLAADVYKQKELVEDIVSRIDEMGKTYPQLANVLTLYYVNGYNWERVCTELSYSWIHMHRLHGQALGVFKKKYMMV